MFIFVGCAGGGSSSMFCQKIVEAIHADTTALTATFDDVGSVINDKKNLGDRFDLIFAYGGIDFISNVTAFDFGTIFDVVFVAPQVRYRTKDKVRLLQDYPTIVRDLDSKIFGTMNGPVAFSLLLDELLSLDLLRSSVSPKHPETKNGDKNIELLILDGERDGRFFKNFFGAAEKMGFRIVQQDYSLETLFDFHPREEFDLRFLFADSRTIDKSNFPKMSRRIDGVVNVPFDAYKLHDKETWFVDYDIPVYNFNTRNVAIQDGAAEWDAFQPMFADIVEKSEFTREVSPPAWEDPVPIEEQQKQKKSLFGIFSWTKAK